jgi:hypothetical protein
MKKYNEVIIEVVAWIVVIALFVFVIKTLNQ